MPEKNKLREKLLQNVALIKNEIPEFDLTEEQIDKMLSDRRLEVHEKAKQFRDYNDPEISGKIDREVTKYLPNTSLPGSFSRNYFHHVKIDGSPEAEAFNKSLLTNLSRDDKLGEQARINFMLVNLNTPAKMDVTRCSSQTDLADLAEYSMEVSDIAGVSMENKNMMNNMNGISLKDQEKYEWMKNFGETVGGVLRDFPKTAKEESFLTFPMEFLAQQQLDQLMTAIVRKPDGALRKALGDDASQAMKALAREQERRKLDGAIAEYKSKNPGSFTEADVQFIKPHRERYGGGLENRMKRMSEAMELLSEKIDPQSIDEIRQAFSRWTKAMKAAGAAPDRESLKRLAEEANQVSRSVFELKKALPGDADPSIAAGADRFMTTMNPFIKTGSLENLFSYAAQPPYREPMPDMQAYREDFAFIQREFEKTDSVFSRDSDEYKALQTAVKDLNQKLGKDGSGEYNFDDLSSALESVSRCAEAYRDTHRGKELSSRMQERLKAISRLEMLTGFVKEKTESPLDRQQDKLALKLVNASMKAVYGKNKSQPNADVMTDGSVIKNAVAELKNGPAFRSLTEGKTPAELDAMLKTKGLSLFTRYMSHKRELSEREKAADVRQKSPVKDLKPRQKDF